MMGRDGRSLEVFFSYDRAGLGECARPASARMAFPLAAPVLGITDDLAEGT